jgi:hypothetical protein
VFGLSIACLVVGAAGGGYLAARFLPPLARTTEGVIATWVVRVLFAGAVAWTALQLYFMIYGYVNLHHEGGFPARISGDKTEILTGTVQQILLYGAILVGSASIIYLLAPTDDADERPVSQGPRSQQPIPANVIEP